MMMTNCSLTIRLIPFFSDRDTGVSGQNIGYTHSNCQPPWPVASACPLEAAGASQEPEFCSLNVKNTHGMTEYVEVVPRASVLFKSTEVNYRSVL